jgi:hypothetical protein
MTTKTNRLASGKMARIALGAVAATALTAATATPAMADDYRDRDRIGAGEIIAGAVVIGGIAALAGAFDGDRDDRRYDYRDRDFRGDRGGWDRGGGFDRGGFGFNGGPRAAVDRCVRAAENQARRFGGYRFADVVDVRDIDRTRDGFRVSGRIEVGGGWNRRGADRGSFRCRVDGRGAPIVDFDGLRGLR